jgi:WD40 repeat protein
MRATLSLSGLCKKAVVALVLCLLGPVATAYSQEAPRSTPGLVLATNGRTGSCDVLTFTPDGTRLLAVGDDKVVRRWIVDDAGFSARKLSPLRWPIFREQRGAIFALALSPDRGADQVAIAGHGTRVGLVMVLDRYTGQVVHSLKDVPSPFVIWSITFSPSGKHVVYGNDVGQIYRWDIGAGATRFTHSGAKKQLNRVRHIHFLDSRRFLSVAQSDRKVLLWRLDRPTDRPEEVATLKLPDLYRVAISPDGRWLAATGENREGADIDIKRVELIDLRKALSGNKDYRRFFKVPQPAGGKIFHYPINMAFDGNPKEGSRRLAVGARVNAGYYKDIGGLVYLYDVISGKALNAANPINVENNPQALAFRPVPSAAKSKWRNQLATAGGNNHEVRLWDVSVGQAARLDEIRSPGSCLWGVALSAPPAPGGKSRYLAWKEKRSADPTPTRWGDGEWRVFDTEKHAILPRPPAHFKPVLPLARYTSPGEKTPWFVEKTESGFVWRVRGPGVDVALDSESGLYDAALNNPPRCYTFIKESTNGKVKKPVRLAVGHAWGASLYECRRGKVTLVRIMRGHEGEVFAVAPSADGTLLVSASRDQTLACWSLVDWPTPGELGAGFRKSRNGKLIVREVSLGSPAWEALNPLTGAEDDRCRLAEGDEIDMVLLPTFGKTRGVVEAFLYDPRRRFKFYQESQFPHLKNENIRRGNVDEVIERLHNARPNQEHIFLKRVGGKEFFKNTSVIQRPLWRFFPERKPEGRNVLRRGGQDWVLWRFRDFAYDTNSAAADNYVGWQVNRGPNDKPDFFPLERLRTRFQQPAKVWSFFDKALQVPDKVIFPDIQPPQVTLEVVTQPDKANDLVLRLSIRPTDSSPSQRLGRVINLWLNDYKYPIAMPKPDAKGGIEVPRLVIKRSELRHGPNVLTLQAYNVEGGRGQATRRLDFDDGTRPVRNLRALCVGINDYSRVRGYSFANLRCSTRDAAEMVQVLRQQSNSRLYEKADVRSIPQERATAEAILSELRSLGKQARPDDWLVLFLSGHGYAQTRSADDYEPGSFFYLCVDTDRNRQTTKLTSKRLYDTLAEIRCSKLVILDCCHSGDVASNPLRDLAREGVPFLILSSCKNNQSSYEPVKGKHGLFTQSLLAAIGDAETARGKRRLTPVSSRQIRDVLTRRLAELLEGLNEDPEIQTPEFLPVDLSPDPILCKP